MQPNLSPCLGDQAQLHVTAWNKWVVWRCRQQIDPVCTPLSETLNYISTLLKKAYCIEL